LSLEKRVYSGRPYWFDGVRFLVAWGRDHIEFPTEEDAKDFITDKQAYQRCCETCDTVCTVWSDLTDLMNDVEVRSGNPEALRKVGLKHIMHAVALMCDKYTP